MPLPRERRHADRSICKNRHDVMAVDRATALDRRRRRRRPPPLTLARRWATVLLVLIGGTLLVRQQLTGSDAGPATLPLPVPLQPPTGGDHSSSTPSSADAAAARRGLHAAVEAGRLAPSQADDANAVISPALAALSADPSA